MTDRERLERFAQALGFEEEEAEEVVKRIQTEKTTDWFVFDIALKDLDEAKEALKKVAKTHNEERYNKIVEGLEDITKKLKKHKLEGVV